MKIMGKLILRFSKKENDWIYESDNKETMSIILFFIAKGLIAFLKNNGYDYTTLRITCNKIKTK